MDAETQHARCIVTRKDNELLKIDVSRQGPAAVLRLVGAADIGQPQCLRDQLLSEARDAGPKLILDLGALTFICSTWLGALIQIHRDCRDAGGQVRLVAPASPVLNVLQTMRLTEIMPVFPTVEQALAPD